LWDKKRKIKSRGQELKLTWHAELVISHNGYKKTMQGKIISIQQITLEESSWSQNSERITTSMKPGLWKLSSPPGSPRSYDINWDNGGKSPEDFRTLLGNTPCTESKFTLTSWSWIPPHSQVKKIKNGSQSQTKNRHKCETSMQGYFHTEQTTALLHHSKKVTD
jgi:hypothetical protein